MNRRQTYTSVKATTASEMVQGKATTASERAQSKALHNKGSYNLRKRRRQGIERKDGSKQFYFTIIRNIVNV